MPKYKEYVDKMLNQNKEAFDSFREIHDKYALNPGQWQEVFNKEGGKVMYLVRRYEDMLCNRSEGSGYGHYSGGLAEKFQSEVRKIFPQIDKIGIIPFSIKKITLK
jgi:hypothetical protein